MKLLSLLLPAALFAASASAVKYNYTLSGDSSCVLINIAMDESGSMQTEHDWMKTVALPTMVTKLETEAYGYDYVFVCSNGFGEDSNNEDTDSHGFRFMGCSIGYDESILGWETNQATDTEDGYHAIEKAIEDVEAIIDGVDLASTCKTMDKNMILVTDEVRRTVVQYAGTALPVQCSSTVVHSTSHIPLPHSFLSPSHFNLNFVGS
jgi:alkyl hydroperoxide reductase subunit AhpC